jgi:flagellar protein FlbD
MIRLTKINEAAFYLNSDLIEHIEMTPDTVITMVNGGKVLAKESAEEVVRRVVEFRRRIHGSLEALTKDESQPARVA